MDIAYAVVRDDPPRVFLAEHLDVLHRLLALEVVAETPASALPPAAAERIQSALLDERWADGVTEWIAFSEIPVDVYTDGIPIWTEDDLDSAETTVALQFRPLFRSMK